MLLDVLDVSVVELMLDDIIAIGRHLCMCGRMIAYCCEFCAVYSVYLHRLLTKLLKSS